MVIIKIYVLSFGTYNYVIISINNDTGTITIRMRILYLLKWSRKDSYLFFNEIAIFHLSHKYFFRLFQGEYVIPTSKKEKTSPTPASSKQQYLSPTGGNINNNEKEDGELLDNVNELDESSTDNSSSEDDEGGTKVSKHDK